mgnify:CR=1 FL=1
MQVVPALGARVGRSSGRRWFLRTISGGEGSTVGAAMAAASSSTRRPWRQGGEGESRRGNRGRIDRDGTEEEDPRRCAVPGTQAGRQVAWQHGRARASGTRSASDWRGGDDDWQLGQWAALLGWVSGQVSSLSISLFLIISVFYYSVNLGLY